MTDELLKSLANLGAVGVLIWLVIFIFRSLLPDALQRFTNELERQRTEFTRALSEITAELRLQREQWHATAAQFTQELRGLAKEVAELRHTQRGKE